MAIFKTGKNPGEEEIREKVRGAVSAVGGMGRFVKPGDLVILKPNLVISMGAETGATVDWRVTKAVADLVKEQGGRPVIGESCGTGGDTEKVFQKTGYTQLREKGYEVVDFKKIENVEMSIPGAKVIEKVLIPTLVRDADVIVNIPKMKTHDQIPMSGALKNMKGALAEKEKNRLHKDGLNQGVAEINALLKPKLVVFDGIIAQEGLGPVFGDPVEMDLILAADDPVAVDAVVCRIMEIDPKEVLCIGYAEEMGLGTSDPERIEIVGRKIEEVRRRFKSSDEDMKKIAIPGFEILFDETSCTGCRNTVYSVIKDMQTKGLLQKLEGVKVVAGAMEGLPDLDRKDIVLVGACTAKMREEGVRFAPGCPPRNYWVIEAVTGAAQQSRGADFRSNVER
ncbi:MAG TPA: DUF362 domain-containing protein [Thermodesulfobacteriota bacterium]|nr:DUF362 domain-containing protein [Thermodesulfobacteriota bacterium]